MAVYGHLCMLCVSRRTLCGHDVHAVNWQKVGSCLARWWEPCRLVLWLGFVVIYNSCRMCCHSFFCSKTMAGLQERLLISALLITTILNINSKVISYVEVRHYVVGCTPSCGVHNDYQSIYFSNHSHHCVGIW